MDLRALIFMPALVGAVVFGFVFLLFFCNYYLTVLESTGAGAKEVTWVSEPILDNFWKLWYLLWLGGLWFGPAYFIGRAATGGSAPWVALAIPFLVLWVCYPVSQLSSLSASSIWMPLSADVFARLAQKPAVTLGFFALSAVALAVVCVGFKWTFQTAEEWSLLLVGAPLLVVGALLYARLLGRLAFALRFTKGLFPTKKKKKRTPEAVTEREAEVPADEPAPPMQPSELPPLSSPDGELAGYDVLMADDPPSPAPRKLVRAEVAEPKPQPAEVPVPTPPETPPSRRRPAPEGGMEPSRVWDDEDDEAATPYGVHEAEVQPEERIPEEVAKPKEEEVRLLRRDDAPKKPRRVWGPELLVFLGQPGTVSAIMISSSLCFVLGALVRIARAYNPVAGGG